MTGCSVHYLFWGISIHAPTRGATRVCGLYRILNHDFNPRSHEGSDYLPVTVSGGNAISIHAPTRGATQCDIHNKHGSKISIHAPTRGATKYDLADMRSMFISIHAPTRGATGQGRFSPFPIRISIHAPTRGATAIFAKKFSFLSAKIV